MLLMLLCLTPLHRAILPVPQLATVVQVGALTWHDKQQSIIYPSYCTYHTHASVVSKTTKCICRDIQESVHKRRFWKHRKQFDKPSVSPSGNTPGPGGYPSSTLFGLSQVTPGLGESTGIGPTDQLGLNMYHGGTLAHDLDYPTPIGTTVEIPGKPTDYLQYLGPDNGAWGNMQVFQTPNGGVIEFNHLGDTNSFKPGSLYKAGTVVGKTGGPFPEPYWSGPHLGIIVDTKGYQWLQSL